MNEKLAFVMQMKDRITGPSRKMAAALTGVRKALVSVKALGAGALSSVGDSADRLRSKFGKLGRAAEKTGRSTKKPFSFASNSAVRTLSSMADGLLRVARLAVMAGGALAGIGAGLIVKSVVGQMGFAEHSRMALGNLTGGQATGEAAFQDSIRLAKTYGLAIDDTTQKYQKLLAAQFKTSDAQDLIKMTTDLRAIGASAEETKSAIRAITQIKAKGRLQAEELVGQLAEAGVATTLVYDALSKSLGVDVGKVRKMITAGAVDADTGIAAIKAAVLKKAGIKEAGEAGKRFADGTMRGMLQRLKNAPGNLAFSASEFMGSAGNSDVKNILRDITQSIEAINPGRIAGFVGSVLQLIRGAVPLVKAFGAGFSDGFAVVMEGLGGASGGMKNKTELFRHLGEVFAKLIGIGLQAGEVFAKALVWLDTPAGRGVGGLVLGGIALAKINAVGTKVMAFFTSLGSVLAAIAGSAIVAKIVFGLMGVVNTVWMVLAAFGGLAIGITASLALAAAAVFIWWDEIGAFFSGLYDKMFDFGANAGFGFIEGLKSLNDAILNWPMTIVDAVKGALEINSPSRVFAELGEFSGQGFLDGLRETVDAFGDGGMVNAMAGDGGGMMPAASPGAAGMGGMSATFHITVNGGDPATAAETGQKVGESAAQSFGSMIEQIFTGQGG